MKNFGWDSEFRKFLRLRILDIVFVPAMGILNIVLTASVLKALFCEDLWMGAQSFKGFCVWGFGISISCPMMLYVLAAYVLEALFIKNFGWASKFRTILGLGFWLSFSVPVMGILDIVLTAKELEPLVCGELWMGLRVSNVFLRLGILGIVFSCPVWGLWMSFSSLKCSRHCFVNNFGWASRFRIILCLGIWVIVFRARLRDFGYPSHRRGARGIVL